MEEYAIIAPQSGIKTDAPSMLLHDAFNPRSENSWVHNMRIDRATMRLKEFSAQLPDDPLGIFYYKRKSLTNFLMTLTRRDIVYRDSANDRFVYLTPQYTTGVIMVENASNKIYGGLLIDDCDDDPVDWADRSGGDVTPSKETTTVKENSVSVKLAVVAGAGVENLASNNNAAGIDLSAQDSIGFWFRSTVTLAAGDLKFKLNDAVDLGGVDQESIDIPVITADTWTWVNIAMADPSNCSAIKSWGIYQAVDKGAMDLFIDFIVAGDWAGQLAAEDFIKIGSAVASSDDTWYEIATGGVVSDTELTLTAVYAGSTAYQQAYIARDTFNGTDTDLWDFDVCSEDIFVATNNKVDTPVSWNGSDTTVSTITGAPKSACVICYEGYTIWGQLVNQPQRIQWSDKDDFDEYAAGDSGTKNVGRAGKVMGFAFWQDSFVTFKEDSIQLGWLVESSLIFNFDTRVTGIGCKAIHSIVTHLNRVYFWSNDNRIRVFNGQHANEDLSEPIGDIVDLVAVNYEEGIYGTYIEELKQLWWAIPSGAASTFNDLVLTLDEETISWGQLDLEVICFGSYITETDLTWDTLPWATWDEWPGKWDDRTFTSNAPIDLVGNRDNYIYRVHGAEQDNAVDFTGFFELNQNGFGKPNLRKRLLRYRAYFEKEVGGTISLQIRMDSKTALETASSKNLDDQGDRDVQEIEVLCDYSGKFFGLYVSATNAFRFIGVIYEFETIGDR